MPLTSEQYNLITRHYDDLRRKNRHELEKRQDEIAEKIPQIAEIDSRISDAGIGAAKAGVNGNKELAAALREETEDLFTKKRNLLIMNGYPADYLEMKYSCDDCRDTGYIGSEKCRCFKALETDLLYRRAGIYDMLKRESFDTFCYDYYSNTEVDPFTKKTPLENIDDVVDICHNFIRDFDANHDNLLFMGETGVGKTFLTNCIAGELLKRGHSVVYLSAKKFFDTLGDYYFHPDRVAPGSFSPEEIKTCDLLIIDDLGTEVSSSYTLSAFFECVNERLISARSTIISTNQSLEDLNTTYSERIFSRLVGNYTIIKIFGDDIRRIKRERTQGRRF